jgi:hypothetical protein
MVQPLQQRTRGNVTQTRDHICVVGLTFNSHNVQAHPQIGSRNESKNGTVTRTGCSNGTRKTTTQRRNTHKLEKVSQNVPEELQILPGAAGLEGA